MAEKYVSIRNINFLLHEVIDTEQIRQLERFQDYDKEAFEMTIDAAKQIGDQHLFPFYTEMDKKKAYFEKGEVNAHPQLKVVNEALGEGGWISAYADYNVGGQQMPLCLVNAGLFIFYAANSNAAAYAFLTQGAANLILNFGSEKLKQTYIPKMYAGKWQGTMALTEPQAGSSLSDIISSATPTSDGHYKIKGQKIFISSGDYNCTENVVHLFLARIKGAPAGTKGISLFVVPKHRMENNQLVSNDVTTAGIFGKMGQKGYVAAHLMYGEKDDCQGYLVGKENQGLKYMFQMMNEARIGTGLLASGTASAAYYASLQYANERVQGRHISAKSAALPQVPIIEHADVKRMLLFQKSTVEGSASLLLYCSYLSDLSQYAEGEDKENAHLLLELLTPIAKSYPAEMGIHSVSMGMQVLGGAGYCDDFPLEQMYRDIRVNAIYEGTTTIHGMDILGRKVMSANGKAFSIFLAQINGEINHAKKDERLKKFANQLEDITKKLQNITFHLMGIAKTNKPEVFLADATLYLEYFGIVTIAWQWLKQAVVASKAIDNGAIGDDLNFYQGKIYTLKYFFEYEMPKTLGLHQRLKSEDRITMDIDEAYLN